MSGLQAIKLPANEVRNFGLVGAAPTDFPLIEKGVSSYYCRWCHLTTTATVE